MKGKISKRLGGVLSAAVVVSVFTVVISAMVVTGKIDIGNYVSHTANEVKNVSDDVTNDAGAAQTATDSKKSNSSKDTGEISTPDSLEGSDEEINIKTLSAVPTQTSKYTSVSDVMTDARGNVYVADYTGKKVYKLNSGGTVLATYSAESEVNGLYVNGSDVYVLEGGLAGVVTVLDTSGLTKKGAIEVGHTPISMVVNGTTGYVANRYSNNVSVINLNTYTIAKTIAVDGREPQALALANGKVYVACHLPDESSIETLISANVVIINTNTNKVTKTIDIINGAGGVKDICAAPDGSAVYVSHIIARYAYPTTQLDRGWINTNAFSIINTSTDEVKANVLLDEVELGAANPWGIAVSGDGSKLVCALSGTDQIMVVDIAAMNDKISKVKNGNGVVDKVSDIADYLPFLEGCRERINLSGKGARAVYAAGSKIYVGLYFDGTVDVVNLDNNSVSNISFVTQPENDEIRMGEIIFSDATLCYQYWQSCLSCHPDARADGFNWDNLNDGLGNPKSARSMLYSHRTPPVMATGIRANAEVAVRAGMKFIQFNMLEEQQMAYIDEYLKSLQPVQSPYLNRDGTLTESAANGKEIFESAGCVTCHPAPLYTDFKLHATKSVTDTTSWENRDMETPTLVEVWRTGPWVFDGRFETMEDTIRYYAQDKGLTDSQLTDLTNFVLSIGNEGELYGVEQILTVAESGNLINALTPGGKITQLTVRCQKEGAPDTANVTLTLTNAKGKKIKSVTKKISKITLNSAVLIEYDTPISIPGDLMEGSTMKVSITDENGKALASELVIEY